MSGDHASYRRPHNVEESKVGDRVVLYHCDSREAVVLNPTGSWLWQLLATSQTKPTLAEQLQSRFPSLKDEQAMSDTSAFLDDLLEHGMLVEEK
jgi:hypothetical protein